MPLTPDAQHYRIGLVSRLTGVPVPTIRMWERRYQVVTPLRTSGGARLYSERDVAKLSLLRRAVEQGHSVGTVVALSVEDLRQRLRATIETVGSRQICRLAVIGSALGARVRAACDAIPGVDVIGQFDDIAGARRELVGQGADVIMAEQPSLQPSDAEALLELTRRSRPRMLMVVYGFSSQPTLRQLDQDRVFVFRVPVEAAQLVRASLICLNLPLPCLDRERRGVDGSQATESGASRRFTDAQLARVVALPSNLRCECPRHLSDLLTNLNAFENYSAQCADAGPEDAAVHRMLRATAVEARRLLEDALGQVLRAEQIDPDAL